MTNQSFNLDLIPNGISPQVHVSQYDKGQTWLISLFAGNTPFNVPSGASVVIQGTKPDQTGFQYDCTYSDNVVTAIEQQQMTVKAGKVPCEIVISKSDAIIASLNFYLIVEPAALSEDTVISETDLPLIEEAAEAVERIPAMIEQIEGLVEDSEAWAKGTKGGDPVTSSDPQYHANAKWYADQAAQASGNPPTSRADSMSIQVIRQGVQMVRHRQLRPQHRLMPILEHLTSQLPRAAQILHRLLHLLFQTLKDLRAIPEQPEMASQALPRQAHPGLLIHTRSYSQTATQRRLPSQMVRTAKAQEI